MYQKINEMIASQCAPVLMDVKPSNLLILSREEEAQFLSMEQIPGIESLCLHTGERKSTWLVYRRDRLEAVVLWPHTRRFLESYGYYLEHDSLDEMLERLSGRYVDYRLGRMEFPHEMGVFLGYPLPDVKGFIEHQGKDFLCSGYWKVYQDEEKAKSTFQLYRTVRDRVFQMIHAGSDLYEICYQAS